MINTNTEDHIAELMRKPANPSIRRPIEPFRVPFLRNQYFTSMPEARQESGKKCKVPRSGAALLDDIMSRLVFLLLVARESYTNGSTKNSSTRHKILPAV